jgi:ATP-dependent DNA helicase RecG
VFIELRKRFHDYTVGIVHSKIKQEDKEVVMERFGNNEINLLVSTTVIEVGVDVPNATLMVVLDSDRFGLSQLHQLRGRIGRSDVKSYCLLVYKDDDEIKERLTIMEQTDDGFRLSEEDLRLRGTGEFFGFKQSGIMKFNKADLIRDYKIVEIAREDALEILLDSTTYKNKLFSPMYNYLKSELKKTNFD